MFMTGQREIVELCGRLRRRFGGRSAKEAKGEGGIRVIGGEDREMRAAEGTCQFV